MAYSMEITPPKVWSTEFKCEDSGRIFNGPVIVARDIDEADDTVEFYRAQGEFHHSLIVVGELVEIGDDVADGRQDCSWLGK